MCWISISQASSDALVMWTQRVSFSIYHFIMKTVLATWKSEDINQQSKHQNFKKTIPKDNI